jgi:hypothetical protein
VIYSRPITELVQERYSCRTYQGRPIDEPARLKLASSVANLKQGPFGTRLRLVLLASTTRAGDELRGLGTYGVIRGAAGFLVGAVQSGAKDMEDLGYAMEQTVLLVTDLGLGTCWLGGTFNRSSFATRAALNPGETMPAVVALGYIAERRALVDRLMRSAARSTSRRMWNELFFDGRFGVPLLEADAGPFANVLKNVRRAPSASNKQPWRVVQSDHAWHFYLQRTPGYGRMRVASIDVSNLQRVDLGIAMCHFALTASELGIEGDWRVREPPLALPDDLTQYVASWVPSGATSQRP